MKKLFFTLALVLGVFSVSNAQEVGQMWIGGTAGIWYESVKDGDDFTSYKIVPEFGYVVTENIGVGINVGFVHQEGTQGTILGNDLILGDMDGVIVNPFVRYTFAKGSVGGLFVDGGVGYTYSKEKSGFKRENNMLEVGFRPGAAVKVSDNVSLIGKFGFLGYEYSKVGDTKRNSFGLDLDMRQFQIGASIVF
jgi:hypothetical protein